MVTRINNNPEENNNIALQQWKKNIDSKNDSKSNIFSTNETPGPKRTEKLTDFVVRYLEGRGLLTGKKKALIPKLTEALSRVNPKNVKEAEAALGIYLRENEVLLKLGFDQSEIKDIHIKFDYDRGKAYVRAIGANDVLLVENTIILGEGGPEKLTGDDINNQIDEKEIGKKLKLQPKNQKEDKAKEGISRGESEPAKYKNENRPRIISVIHLLAGINNDDDGMEKLKDIAGTNKESKKLDEEAYNRLQERKYWEEKRLAKGREKKEDNKVMIAVKKEEIINSIMKNGSDKSGILSADKAKLNAIQEELEDTRQKSATRIA